MYKPVKDAFIGRKIEKEVKQGKLVTAGEEDDNLMWLEVVMVSDYNKDMDEPQVVKKGDTCLVEGAKYCHEQNIPGIGACHIAKQGMVLIVETKGKAGKGK